MRVEKNIEIMKDGAICLSVKTTYDDDTAMTYPFVTDRDDRSSIIPKGWEDYKQLMKIKDHRNQYGLENSDKYCEEFERIEDVEQRWKEIKAFLCKMRNEYETEKNNIKNETFEF